MSRFSRITSSKKTLGYGPVQHLGQREFRLYNRNLVPVTGLPVSRGEGMRQLAEPLAQQPSIFSSDKPSQIACTRRGSSQERMPLSNGSQVMPRLPSCCLT